MMFRFQKGLIAVSLATMLLTGCGSSDNGVVESGTVSASDNNYSSPVANSLYTLTFDKGLSETDINNGAEANTTTLTSIYLETYNAEAVGDKQAVRSIDENDTHEVGSDEIPIYFGDRQLIRFSIDPNQPISHLKLINTTTGEETLILKSDWQKMHTVSASDHYKLQIFHDGSAEGKTLYMHLVEPSDNSDNISTRGFWDDVKNVVDGKDLQNAVGWAAGKVVGAFNSEDGEDVKQDIDNSTVAQVGCAVVTDAAGLAVLYVGGAAIAGALTETTAEVGDAGDEIADLYEKIVNDDWKPSFLK